MARGHYCWALQNRVAHKDVEEADGKLQVCCNLGNERAVAGPNLCALRGQTELAPVYVPTLLIAVLNAQVIIIFCFKEIGFIAHFHSCPSVPRCINLYYNQFLPQ